jgi:hypothetical protein
MVTLTLDTLRKYRPQLQQIGPDYVRRLWNRHQFRPEFDLALISGPPARRHWPPEDIFRPGQNPVPVAQVTLTVIEDLLRRVTYTLNYLIYPSGLILRSSEVVPYHNPGAQSAYSGIVDEWMALVRAAEEEAEAKARAVARCAAIKEELMAETWKPERVERLLAAGVALEDV